MKRASPVLIFTLCTFALGQSASELQNKYSAIEVYKVHPSVWMTPSYSVGGQVCKLILEKRHTTTEGNGASAN